MLNIAELKKKRIESKTKASSHPSDEEIRKVEVAYMAGRSSIALVYDNEEEWLEASTWWKEQSHMQECITIIRHLNTINKKYEVILNFLD